MKLNFFRRFEYLIPSIPLKLIPGFLVLLVFTLTTGSPHAATYSYSNYVSIPTLMATPQWCPSDAPITYQENQPTYFTASSLSACGYPAGTYDPNYFAAIDSDSFGDTAASGGNGGGLGGYPCGACAALYNSATSKSVTVMITDECPQGGANANNCWVGSYHLDLSQTAYNALLNGGSFPSNTGTNTLSGSTVTWRFVQCPLTGNANVEFNNSTGNVAYEWANGSSSTWAPIMFLDVFFPIKSVTINGASVSRQGSASQIPNFWGAGAYSGNLTCVLTSYETSVAPLTVTVSSGSFTPKEGSPPGTTTTANIGCVTGPTPTPTSTSIPGTATPTPTITRTPTLTVTATPTATIGGCLYTYYDGETTNTDLASGSTWVGNATIAENATAKHTGSYGMDISYNWPASSYYAEIGWNWTQYNASSARIVNLGNYQYVQFDIDVAAGSPLTLAAFLVDEPGAGAAQTFTGEPQLMLWEPRLRRLIRLPLPARVGRRSPFRFRLSAQE